MDLIAPLQLAPRAVRMAFLAIALGPALFASGPALSQPTAAASTPTQTRAHRFLQGRAPTGNLSAAQAMQAARSQHAAMLQARQASPNLVNLTAPWQPVGPNQVATPAYGNVTGRITAIALDPADPTGNTVYLGTTGGGVWKSTNAAGAPASVTFAPLTDTLPVFSPNSSVSAIPSLSIGAVSVQPGTAVGVVLAGTGDPNDASDSLYGSGILRSTDAGLTWSLIPESHDGAGGNHAFTGLGFAGFAWSTASPATVVAAVSQAAEGVIVNAPDQTNSVMGLYYSTEAGATWQMSTIMDGSQTVQTPLPSGQDLGGRAATAVVWNPIRQRFYAAIRYHGFYESPDGALWTRLANQPGPGLTLAACPTAPTGTGNPSCPLFRGALAVQPVTGDTFALAVDGNNIDQGLWQDVCSLSGSTCSGSDIAFATRLNAAPLETTINGNPVIPQADYNLALAAVSSGPPGPTQDTVLYAGTIDLYRCSLAAGCLLRNTTNDGNACAAPAQVAPAQHAIATLATGSQPLLFLGNDGGLWRSSDGVNQQQAPCTPDDANHFQNLNSGLGSLAEVVSFAQPPTDPATLLVGLGANGTAGTSTATSLATPWPQLAPGEGGAVAIDPANPLLWAISNGPGVSIHQCTAGAACTPASFTSTIGRAQTASDDSLIDPPWLLDPALPATVLIGTCRVWRGPVDNGALWSSSNAISSLLAGPQNSSCAASNPVLRSLAAGDPAITAAAPQNAGSTVLYAGMAGRLDGGGPAFGGHLFATTTANIDTNATAWTDLAASPVTNDTSGSGLFNPGGFDLSSIAVDPHDPTGRTIYATVMGFTNNGTNAPHLYSSTDGGAHWLNISSNLPNAPANSVAVDPNDANTVYVALDTGVYVTQAVATCAPPGSAPANCWSIYGASLPNAPVVQLAAAPDMPTGDGRLGELRAATYGRGIWQIPLLNAVSSIQPAISLSPAALTFATQAVATASQPQTITLTNTGPGPLTVTQVGTAGDFIEADTCTTAPIAPTATCTIQVRFLPTALGSRTGLLTVYGNVSGGQATAQLTGTGSAASPLILTPLVLRFPATTINAASVPQNITLSNTGTSPIALQTPILTGDFRFTANTCGPTLAPQTGCTVSIAFTPTASGPRSGTFTITDDAGTQTASFSGIGTSPATDALSPLTLTFPAQQITSSSHTQQLLLTNSGDLALTLIAAQVTSGDFTAVNTCGNSLNPHATCAIQIAFQPKDVGQLTGLLSVSDQYRTQTVALNGTGIAPPGVSLAPFAAVAFPPAGVGLTSPPQTVTLTNNGGAPLTLQTITLTGDFALAPGGQTCGPSLPIGSACTMQVVFAPTAGGPRSGSLTVRDNSPNSPQILQLTGTGVDFTLISNGPASFTIPSGQSAVFPLLLSSSANIPGTAAFTCTGLPANATCNITPASPALGSATTIAVTILTGVASTAATTAPAPPGGHPLLWLATLLPLSLLSLPRLRRTRLPHLPRLTAAAFLYTLFTLTALSGCGAGRQIPLAASPTTSPVTPGAVTPAGTYTITASATSAGLTRTVNLTLIVR